MITSGIPPPQSWARQVRDKARPERPTAEHNDGKPPEPAFLRSFADVHRFWGAVPPRATVG